MVVALLSLLLAGAAIAQNDENCLPGTWLPEGADWTSCAEPGVPYDGSKVPDCSAFHGQVNTTSFFHVHEYGEILGRGKTYPQIAVFTGCAVPRVRV